MIVEHSVVTRVGPDGLWVKSQQVSACQACESRSGCGQQLLAKWSSAQFDVYAALPSDLSIESFSVGDSVKIAISEGALVSGALLVYGLPVILITLLAFMLERLALDASPIGGLAFLLVLVISSFFARHLIHKKNGDPSYFQPLVLGHSHNHGDCVQVLG